MSSNHTPRRQASFAPPLLATLLLWLSFLAVPAHAQPVTELKVMSFNIWVNGGKSLPDCIEAIRRSGADIVGLQECNAATAQTIATGLGFHVQGDTGRSIVSRYKIVRSLPVSGGRGATIELAPGQQVHLFNCHLTAYPYGPYDLKAGKSREFILQQEHATRMPALTNLLAGMKPFLATNEPCFLTGDFNVPSHLDYADFPWPNSFACEAAGLADSYRELHPANRKFPGIFQFDEPGITWTPRIETEPEGIFDRIDFVYYSRGDGATATAAQELDGRNSVSPWPSDHRAVLTTFKLAPPAPPQPPQPVKASIERAGPMVAVRWEQAGPSVVQRKDRLDAPAWRDLGPPLNGSSAFLPAGGTEGWFRVLQH